MTEPVIDFQLFGHRRWWGSRMLSPLRQLRQRRLSSAQSLRASREWLWAKSLVKIYFGVAIYVLIVLASKRQYDEIPRPRGFLRSAPKPEPGHVNSRPAIQNDEDDTCTTSSIPQRICRAVHLSDLLPCGPLTGEIDRNN